MISASHVCTNKRRHYSNRQEVSAFGYAEKTHLVRKQQRLCHANSAQKQNLHDLFTASTHNECKIRSNGGPQKPQQAQQPQPKFAFVYACAKQSKFACAQIKNSITLQGCKAAPERLGSKNYAQQEIAVLRLLQDRVGSIQSVSKSCKGVPR